MPFAPPAIVEGAPLTRYPFGIFSVVDFRPEGDGRWQNGVEWEPPTCDAVRLIGDPDCTPGPDGESVAEGLPKSFSGTSPALAFGFVVYGSYQCSPIGNTLEAAQDRATAQLLAKEEKTVEAAFWTGSVGNQPSLQSFFAEDLTPAPGTPVSPVLALALLESYNARSYRALGVIHASRGAAIALLQDGVLKERNGTLYTGVGTPVIAGSGYSGSAPGDIPQEVGTSWVYITPALFGYRSDIFTSSDRPGDLLDKGRNDMYAVAERKYLIGYDPCGVGAVHMAVECC